MRRKDARTYREVLQRSTARWLTVRANGIMHRGTPRTDAVVTILSHGAARTLYHHQRPTCRSLDGVMSIGREPARLCDECPDKGLCTAQIRLELVLDNTPYRLLLAYTSAKNFLVYVGRLRLRQLELDRVVTSINVVPHGHWGELRFNLLA